MDFNFTENQKAIQCHVFAISRKSEILPHRMDWDERQHICRGSSFEKMGAMGLLGRLLVPEDVRRSSGTGLHGIQEYAIEELAQVCGSIGLSMLLRTTACARITS